MRAFKAIWTTLAAMLVLTALPLNVSTAMGQRSAGREVVFPKTIRWAKQPGVTKYRVQIAEDEQFQNVFFDGPVTGEQYLVRDLSAGYYYWRVAPVNSRSTFSTPLRFFISGGMVIPVRLASRGTGLRMLPVLMAPRVR